MIFRILIVLLLLGLAAFCVFGFLASFEYSEPSRRLPWQIGYGVLFAAAAGGGIAVLRRK